MPRSVTVPNVLASKNQRRLVMITAYDAPTARWAENAGVDMILVGDSLAMVVLGHDTTLAVTMEEMLHHARAVMRAQSRCLVVGDLPFGTYQDSVAAAVRSGVRYLKEGGVHAVKLEGVWPDRVEALVAAGVPVMGHLGLTPQSVHAFGGYRVQGKTVDAAKAMIAHARELEDAGCFSVVLEGVPAEVAAEVTNAVKMPTIGIGAGPGCDGQVLVIHDLLGMSPPPRPRFVSPYALLGEAAEAAIAHWARDVRDGHVSTAAQSYHLNEDAARRWRQITKGEA
jgi:3-methyl-2-oxobutanoate hydroxymethyltransferase